MQAFAKALNKNKYLMILVMPAFIYFFVFMYLPMYGLVIAFQDFNMADMFRSKWVGMKWFKEFFDSIYFYRLIKNTVLLSFLGIVFSFPIPIVFALCLNELKTGMYKKIVQTVSYLPYFISVVILVGLMKNMLSGDGVVNNIIAKMGYNQVNFMDSTVWFRPLYIGSGIWQGFGFGSIIYLSALSGVNTELYESAVIDGAGILQKMWHVSIPAIKNTIIIMLILSVGSLMSVGTDKVLLMYSPKIYDVSDVIGTYVYRRGIVGAEFSFSAAVNMFNSLVNFGLMITANALSRRYSEACIW